MPALHAGQILEGTPYQVVRELGAGGMGVVYEVQHVRLRKHYVAKVIHEQIRNEESAQKRMEREADVLGKINHPNIVQVHDVGTTPDGTSYFVMEKLEGLDLRQAMKEGAIGRTRAVMLVIDVLDALRHVHERGIIHRDIKPENIFLAQQPNGIATKVLDFGIVHIFDGDGKSSQARITKTGGFVGTLYYAAPEQMQGSAPAPSSDVYAAGLVLYELIAGRGPFDDDAGVGLTRCFKPAPRLDVPPALADAVAGALEQDPARRPRAGELATMLRHVLSVMPTVPGGPDNADALLRNVVLRSTAGGATAMPKTPVMRGAPGASGSSPALEPTQSARIAPAVSVAPDSPRGAFTASGGTAPTVMSAPALSTSPGVYATVDGARPPPRASGMALFGAIGALVLVAGIIAVGLVGFLMRRAAPKPAAATAPTAVLSEAPAAIPTPALAPSITAEPAAAMPAVAEPSLSASAAPSSTTAPKAAKPAAPKRNAEKDGYMKDL